jgi:hypothetical protein
LVHPTLSGPARRFAVDLDYLDAGRSRQAGANQDRVNAGAVVERKRKSVERRQNDHGKPIKMAYVEKNRSRKRIRSGAIGNTPKGRGSARAGREARISAPLRRRRGLRFMNNIS